MGTLESVVPGIRRVNRLLAKTILRESRDVTHGSAEQLRYFQAIARLLIFALDMSVRDDGVQLDVFELMEALLAAITRSSRRNVVTCESVWRELTSGADSDWWAGRRDVSALPTIPFICEIWMNEHAHEPLTLRGVLEMVADDEIPAMVRALGGPAIPRMML